MTRLKNRFLTLLLMVAVILVARTHWNATRGSWHRLNSKSLYTYIALTAEADSAVLAEASRDIDRYFADFTLHFQNGGPFDEKVAAARVGDTVALDSVEAALVCFAAKARERSGGAIHPGVGNLIREWGLVWGGTPKRPDEAVLARERELLRELPFEPIGNCERIVMRREGTRLALGAFSKGWAIDRAAERLERAGIENYLLEVGGDLRCHGHGPRGGPWRLGVRDARRPDTLATVVELCDALPCAMASSGGYEKFFVDSATGEKHHHILDPRTAMSARGALGTTAFASTALEADLMATWLFVAGPEKAAEVVERNPGSAAYVIPEKGEPFFVGAPGAGERK